MSGRDLTERHIKPGDCVLAMAIPTTEREFYAQRDRGETDSFTGRFHSWDRYWSEVAGPASRLLPEIRKMGCQMRSNVCLRDIGSLFRTGSTVIIPMAHRRDATGGAPEALELADGFAEVSEVVAQIPVEAECILDLSVCGARQLAVAIRRDRPASVTRSTPMDEVTPAAWFYIYFILLQQLKRKRISYYEALGNVISEIRRQTDGAAARQDT